MSIYIEENGRAACRLCGRKRRDDEWFTGPDMWHEMWPTCNHDRFYFCPGCYRDERHLELCKCLNCGREEFYT